MNKPIIIIGTGGFAREVAGLLLDMGLGEEWVAFVERDEVWKQGQIFGKPIWKESTINPHNFRLVVGVSKPDVREKIVSRLPIGIDYPTLIHPSAICSPWVEMGIGTILCAGCILTTEIKLGKHVQLNLNTTIGHNVQLGNFVTTAPAVNISGDCRIGDQVYLGTQAATKQGIHLANGVTLGMGAMAVKDLKEPGTYIGVPARKMS